MCNRPWCGRTLELGAVRPQHATLGFVAGPVLGSGRTEMMGWEKPHIAVESGGLERRLPRVTCQQRGGTRMLTDRL